MKKINIYYYCFVVLVNLCAALVGCSYHSRGYKMHCPSSSRKSLVDHSFFAQSNLDHGLEKNVNDLLKRLEGCFEFIDKKRMDCNIDHIRATNRIFELKQHKDNRHDYELISHNDIGSRRLSETKTQAFKALKASFTSTSPSFLKVYYFDSWQKCYVDRLKAIPLNQSMQSNITDQVVQYPNCQKPLSVLDCIHEDLLPYWREIVQLLILHTFNTSIAQGKISFKKAKEKYKTACEAINNMYSLADIQACAKYFCTKVEKALCSPSKNSCSPLRNIKKNNHTRFLNGLKQYILDPIEDGYDTIVSTVNYVQYRDESNLKKKVAESIEMFYNIASSFGIIDLIFNLRRLVLVYRPSVKRKEACLKKIGREESQLLTAKLYLARFIVGNFNIDLIKKKIRELLMNLVIY